MDQDILEEAGGIEKRSIFKDEDAKDAETYQSWRWDLTGVGVLAVGIVLSCHMPLGPYKATWEN